MSKHVFKGGAVLLLAVLVTVLAAVPALAADARSGETVTIASGEVIDDDLYIAGNSIIIDGIVDGDLWAVGGTITVNGRVSGSIVAVGETVDINGDAAHTVRVGGSNLNIRGNINGDLLAGCTVVMSRSVSPVATTIPSSGSISTMVPGRTSGWGDSRGQLSQIFSFISLPKAV